MKQRLEQKKNMWKQKLGFPKDKQNGQTFSQVNQEKKGRSNK